MTDERLAEFKTYEAAATQGSWMWGNVSDWGIDSTNRYLILPEGSLAAGTLREADCVFITHALASVHELIAEVERLRRRLGELQESVSPGRNIPDSPYRTCDYYVEVAKRLRQDSIENGSAVKAKDVVL